MPRGFLIAQSYHAAGTLQEGFWCRATVPYPTAGEQRLESPMVNFVGVFSAAVTALAAVVRAAFGHHHRSRSAIRAGWHIGSSTTERRATEHGQYHPAGD